MNMSLEEENARLRAENEALRALFKQLVPMFEASRPLVLTYENIKEAVK